MPGAVTLNQPGTFSPSLSFPFEEKLGVGEMLWSGESLRFSFPRFPHPPPQAPGSPGACWEPRPGLWARLVGGGGASSLPLPPHLGLTLAPPEGLGGWEGGKGRLELGPQTRLRPPPPALLLRPLPASPPPSSAGRYPGPGPLLDPPPLHSQLQTWL